MGADPVWNLLFRFSGPAIVSMTVASTYNLVDAVFVGRLGPTALAAMSVTYPMVLSFIAIASGTAVGTTSMLSRSLGSGDHKEADRAACTSITLCFLLSAIIIVSCLPNIDAILHLFGADESVLPLARDYISILIYGTVLSYLSLVMASLIRADGNPLFSSTVAISSSILNIMLDPVLIFGLGPVPSMGISGAAAATVIAQAMGTTAFLIYIVTGRTAYRFRADHFLPHPRVVAGIYRTGFASIVRSGAQFAVMGVVNRTASSFGVTTLAVVGVLVRAGRFVQMPMLGLGQGMLPLVGYNYGAQKKDRVSEIVGKAALAAVAWTGLCWILLMLFPARVISTFNVEPAFLREGTRAVRLYFLAIVVTGLQIVPGFFFQATGKGIPASILSAARHVLFLLPTILVLTRAFGSTGLWLSFPIADLLALLFGAGWIAATFRKEEIPFPWRRVQV